MKKPAHKKIKKKSKWRNHPYTLTHLGSESAGRQGGLVRQRRAKLIAAWEYGLGAVTGTLVSFGVLGKFDLGATATAGVVGFISRYFASTNKNKAIIQSNKDLGSLLKNKAKTDEKLNAFLKEYRYVLFNVNGQLIGTNRPRIFKIGRFRLKTKEILEGVS